MTEHVEKLESGGSVCRHCGGAVDAEGYATGGDVDSPEVNILNSNDDDSETTDQYQSTVRMRRASGFADAVKRRGGD